MTKRNDIRAVYFGTPLFSARVLEDLAQYFDICAVVTQPDKFIGRKKILGSPPVKISAKHLKIPAYQPKKILDILQDLKSLFPDVGILYAYGKILPKEILDIFPHGIVNIHPSLLPKYRGPSPVQQALLNGDRETGVTLIALDEKMDHGPILAQKKISVEKDDTCENLTKKLSKVGSELVKDALSQHMNNSLQPKNQDHSRATFTKIITRDSGEIHWKSSSEYIIRMRRAFYPWPGIFATINNKRIKIIRLKIYDGPQKISGKTGNFFLASDGQIGVYTGDGAVIIQEIQLEGKKPMSSQDALRGNPWILKNPNP